MPKGSRFEIVGTEMPLSQASPVGSPSADPRSGEFQLIGTNTRMSERSIQSPSSNPRGGQTQVVGDEISLSRTPVKGWGNAAHLTMSDRAHEQSKTAAGGAGRKRK